jgi:hypothetical protein
MNDDALMGGRAALREYNVPMQGLQHQFNASTLMRKRTRGCLVFCHMECFISFRNLSIEHMDKRQGSAGTVL